MPVVARQLCIALLLLSAARARADVVHLQWSTPTGSMCPPRSALVSDVEELTGQRFVAHEAHADVRVVGRVAREGEVVVARLEASTAEGEPLGTRELRAVDCPSLRRPLALVLALLLEEPAPEPKLRFGGGVEVALSTVALPRPVPGLGVFAILRPVRWLRVRAGLSWWAPVVAETARGEGARLQALAGSVGLCPEAARRGRFGLGLCLMAELGRTFAEPRGLRERAGKSIAFADASLEATGSLALGRRGALWLSLGPTVSLARPELYFSRADDVRERVHQSHAFGAILRLALTIEGR